MYGVGMLISFFKTFSMFAYEKLSQTINQMEQLIINIINEVQKKVS